MSDSVRRHRRQPTRLPRPWDSPGKNTGVDCHFLLQCMKGKSESEITQSCPTLSDPMDCSLPGFSVHGIFQAKSIGVGCHCLLQGIRQALPNIQRWQMIANIDQLSACSVTQLCPTVCDPMDCSLPGFSVHGIFQARVLEWVAISFSRGSSLPWD